MFLFIADGFEEVEAVTPLDYLRRCGADLTLVGVDAKVIRSSRGLAVTCDITLSELFGAGSDAKTNAEQAGSRQHWQYCREGFRTAVHSVTMPYSALL